MIVDSSIPGWLHVGTRGHWVGRLLVLWILEFWLRTSRRVDTTMEQVVANLQQLSTMLENQQASSAERKCVTSSVVGHVGTLEQGCCRC